MCGNPLDRIYTDLVGPIRKLFLGGAECVLTVLYSYSDFSLVVFLHRTSNPAEAAVQRVPE